MKARIRRQSFGGIQERTLGGRKGARKRAAACGGAG